MYHTVVHIVVMGSGGVGGYFGAKLSRAGERVTFVARGPHLEAIKRSGLAIKSAGEGDILVRPAAVERDRRDLRDDALHVERARARRDLGASHVRVEIEARVVDPDRMVEPERHLDHPPPEVGQGAEPRAEARCHVRAQIADRSR